MRVSSYYYIWAITEKTDAMGYSGMAAFIERLEEEGELIRVEQPVSTSLEIAEIADRMVKNGGKALLFTNNGTRFPLMINAFASQKRMAMALSRDNPDEAGAEIESLFDELTGGSAGKSLIKKLASLPLMLHYARLMPHKKRRKGRCQQNIMERPDLSSLPVLKCWPHDGGPFITLPAVHTFHPETGKRNCGMYRMQVYDSLTAGMHWHRHKTGAAHYRAWKERGQPMPVAVTLGGDPVYTYSATAPLPENIDELILAGFLRRKRVSLVRCLTQPLWVPSDADIVIEGYIDTGEDLRTEGPFGDHTGLYSLTDKYPVFRVTAISYADDAIYPATIVGVPPQEDVWIGETTERLFLSPIKLTMAPEVKDLHMPPAGVAHNLVLVKIDKQYPGQGMKVLNSLFGAGQMMFSKYIVVVDGTTDIRDYDAVINAVAANCRGEQDIMVMSGPLDVLDHASDSFSFGGKCGIDATVKSEEEGSVSGRRELLFADESAMQSVAGRVKSRFPDSVVSWQTGRYGALMIAVDTTDLGREEREEMKLFASEVEAPGRAGVTIVMLEEGTDMSDNLIVLWQITGNTDPHRDLLFGNNMVIDATFKRPGRGGFSRRWPEVVASDIETVKRVDERWSELFEIPLIDSPSRRVASLKKGSGAELSG